MRNRTIDLLRMLEYRRPAGTQTEARFIDHYLMSLPGKPYRDAHGNIHVEVGNDSTVLWSAHTDTVHRLGGMQTIHFDRDRGVVSLSKRSINRGSNCLGADCTVGVWILRNMILRGIPGRYIFHYGEERGGIGSSALARSSADWLKRFQFAIAFDRRGSGSIITHQSGGYRTASDLFALSLEEELKAHGLKYSADDSGLYTDTYEYAEIIPECTNLSVGNADEHRTTETANVHHAERLLDAICNLQIDRLIVDRDPADPANDSWLCAYRGVEVRSFADWKSTYGNPAYGRSETTTARTYNDDVFGVCVTCGETTWIDRHSFTCIDCEYGDDEPIDPRTSDDRAHDRLIYLDSVYEEVQRDLLEMIARQRTNDSKRNNS